MRSIVAHCQRGFQVWVKNDCSGLAAILSFHILLSLTPLLILFVFTVNWVLERQDVQDYIVSQMNMIAGAQLAETISSLLLRLSDSEIISQGIFASVFSFIFLINAASGFMGQLHKSINKIWHQGRAQYGIEDNFLVGMLGHWISGLLLLSVTILYFLFSFMIGLTLRFTGSASIINVTFIQEIQHLNLVGLISLLLGFVYILMLFRLTPQQTPTWQSAVIGATTATLFFWLGNFLFNLFISQVSLTSVYGAAASLMVFMIWIYYAAHVLLAGVIITYVLDEPKENNT